MKYVFPTYCSPCSSHLTSFPSPFVALPMQWSCPRTRTQKHVRPFEHRPFQLVYVFGFVGQTFSRWSISPLQRLAKRLWVDKAFVIVVILVKGGQCRDVFGLLTAHSLHWVLARTRLQTLIVPEFIKLYDPCSPVPSLCILSVTKVHTKSQIIYLTWLLLLAPKHRVATQWFIVLLGLR